MSKVKKGDIVALEYAGYISASNDLFDTNIKEVAEKEGKHDPKLSYEPSIIVVGERHVIVGLDNALEGKEVGKEYEVIVKAEEAFGKRNPELIKTLPLSMFKESKLEPYPGMILSFEDGTQAKILAVQGGRVKVDFNHPLAGKELKYVFRIVEIVEDPKKQFVGLVKTLVGIKIPEEKVEVKDDKLVIKDKIYSSLKEVFEKIREKYLSKIKKIEVLEEENKESQEKAKKK